MAGKTINIEGKSYPIKFGYGAFRDLGEKWGCKGIMATFQKVSELFADMADMSFEQEDVLAELVLSGIKNHADFKGDLPEKADVLNAVIFDVAVRDVFMKAVLDSVPQASGNVKPPKTAAKRPKKK